MSTDGNRRKRFLFVDDDADFLAGVKEIFSGMSRGSWEIATAGNHAQALSLLGQGAVDVVVLDVNMPVMDGVQFLRLLRRTHPGQQAVMLTARVNEDIRKSCLDLGAALFLEKLLTPQGFEGVFAALDALADAVPQTGFQGMMRRVGLQDVLQMECLGRKSSTLEVFTGKARGRIFIIDGDIVHAEFGALQGEVALYGLLALRGGEFNLRPFIEPPRRTISGHYEFLLMEAARLSDEGSQAREEETSAALESSALPDELLQTSAEEQALQPAARTRTEEVLLLSGSGELLYEWGCRALQRRVALINQLEQHASHLGTVLLAGGFERLEVVAETGRAVCQIHPHMRLYVRTSAG